MQTKIDRHDDDSSAVQQAQAGGAVLSDAHPQIVAQRRHSDIANGGPRLGQQRSAASAIQRRADDAAAAPNRTGLPDQLKAGIESLSGISMDGVKVHYNSSQPAQLNAHAYAQGTDIHIAPGQERHLPHEAWHVVQQAQGRVRPTMQLRGKTNINDDAGLEVEADAMGAQAMRMGLSGFGGIDRIPNRNDVSQLVGITTGIVQREVDPDFPTFLAARVLSKPEMQTFYDLYVANEVKRLKGRYIDDDVKTAMLNAETYFILFMLNSRVDTEIQTKLDALVNATNAAAANLHASIVARGNVAGTENGLRDERDLRKGAKVHAGTTKAMELRGVKSKLEAETILTSLHNGMAAALGAAALGHVGVRGSAITGIRTRTQTPFEEGVDDNQNVSDASDLDFFFTSPTLEAAIRRTQHLLPENRRINAGGTMNAQYLKRWLNLGTAQNLYAPSAILLTALTAFETNTLNLIGRKSDITFVGGGTATGLMGDPGTLIR